MDATKDAQASSEDRLAQVEEIITKLAEEREQVVDMLHAINGALHTLGLFQELKDANAIDLDDFLARAKARRDKQLQEIDG